MQTIQELANRFYPEQDHSSVTYNKRLYEQIRETVKFYVTEALKAASEQQIIEAFYEEWNDDGELILDGDNYETTYKAPVIAEGKVFIVDKQSILSAYPLSNIK